MSNASHMWEKYRDVDEDAILSNLTEAELAQLEGEIDREVLNKIPEEAAEPSTYNFTSTESSSSEEEEENDPESESSDEEELRHIAERQRRRSSHGTENYRQRRPSNDHQNKRTGKSPHHSFKVPPLRRTSPNRGKLRKQGSEEGGEMKNELLQAVRQRTKRRTSRANSSGLNRRYTRKNSSAMFKRRNARIAKENRKEDPDVNSNCITQEMLTLRPRLKKVETREPKLNDVLHGVCLKHVTSGAKLREGGGQEHEQQPQQQQQQQQQQQDSEYSNSNTHSNAGSDSEDSTGPPPDDAVAKANDDVHRQLKTAKHFPGGDDVMTVTSSTTAGSTSAESSYDVIGELSINPNSVEETMLRIWENDPYLTEVNLNNIQNVPMEAFEDLANAMEENTQVKTLLLANTGLTDKAARALASMLKRNKTLEKLNVESNFITGDGALRLVAALRRNTCLKELRIDNQRHIFGANVEHEFGKILRDNHSILRFGYQFANPGLRMTASNSLTRNMDQVRKKRVADQRMRAQAARPTLRRQTSSEWYRKEKAEEKNKIQKTMKDNGIVLDKAGAVKDKDVQKLLEKINKSDLELLQNWFTSQMYGMTGEQAEAQQEILERQKSNFKPKSSASSKSSKAAKKNKPVDLRTQLMDSIRSQTPLSGLKKTNYSDYSATESESEADTSNINRTNRATLSPPPARKEIKSPLARDIPTPTPLDPRNAEPPTPSPVELTPNESPGSEKSTSTGSDDVIEWNEEEEYDPDEYEVVEIEVSDDSSEEEEESESDEERSGSNEEEMSRKDAKRNAVKALGRLKIPDPSESAPSCVPTDTGPLKSGLLSPFESSSSSPQTSVSPATPRPVRDDESWIAGRPFYKLGAK